MIQRKKQGIENCKIAYLEEISKIRYPDSFEETTNIDEQRGYIVTRDGSILHGICSDCCEPQSEIKVDFAELAKHCMTVSPGIWGEAEYKPRNELHHDSFKKFPSHAHRSYKQKDKIISIREPFAKVRIVDEERLTTIWMDCYRRMWKMKKELREYMHWKPGQPED